MLIKKVLGTFGTKSVIDRVTRNFLRRVTSSIAENNDIVTSPRGHFVESSTGIDFVTSSNGEGNWDVIKRGGEL